MKTEWGELPEFTAAELNQLISLARGSEHYAKVKESVFAVLDEKRKVISEKQFRFFHAVKRELKDMVEG